MNIKKIDGYCSWSSMKSRCCNPKDKDYHKYGRRGIIVCERWLNSFHDFLEDMGPRPGKGYSIERRDNDGNYCPKNCYWGTDKQQARNRRSSLKITYCGETKCLAEWAEIYNISIGTLWRRIRYYKLDIHIAFNKRIGHDVIITYNNKTQTAQEWADQIGIKCSTLRSRLNSGWSIEDALNTPCDYNKRRKDYGKVPTLPS